MKNYFNFLKTSFTFFAIISIFSTCQKLDFSDITKCKLESLTIDNIINFNIAMDIYGLSPGEHPDYGFCISAANTTPTLSDSIISMGPIDKTTKVYKKVENLMSVTTYYVRGYVMDGDKPVYTNNVLSITTLQSPIIITKDATETSSTTATLNATVNPKGGQIHLSFVYGESDTYGKTAMPVPSTINGNKNTDVFVKIENLTANKIYHYCIIASYSYGTIYGIDKTFSTGLPSAPKLLTLNVTSITQTSASLQGSIENNGGLPIKEYGACWSLSPNPTILDNKSTTLFIGNNFTSILTGLIANTTYYARAYAANDSCIGYGNEIVFTTSPTLASLITYNVNAVNSTSAVGGGEISNDGGSNVFQRGICWSLVQGPGFPWSNYSLSGSGTGSFSCSLSELFGNTTYYVRAFANTQAGLAYGNEISFITSPPIVPSLSTNLITSITTTTASCSAEITSNGGASVTLRGICWSTSTNPSLQDNSVYSGTGTGSFSGSLLGLSPGTIYYVRAFATNIAGTAYGNEISFTTEQMVTDIDGNLYSPVKIGNQVWLKENLKTTRYNDGSPLQFVNNNADWLIAGSAYSWINDAIQNKNIYGALYNWSAIDPNNGRNLCPAGWHVPNRSEWETLINYLGGSSTAGGKMKSTGNLTDANGLWLYPNEGATNQGGFSGFPGGFRSSNVGEFAQLGSNGWWWSSTSNDSEDAWAFYLSYNNTYANTWSFNKKIGLTIRCVKD